MEPAPTTYTYAEVQPANQPAHRHHCQATAWRAHCQAASAAGTTYHCADPAPKGPQRSSSKQLQLADTAQLHDDPAEQHPKASTSTSLLCSGTVSGMCRCKVLRCSNPSLHSENPQVHAAETVSSRRPSQACSAPRASPVQSAVHTPCTCTTGWQLSGEAMFSACLHIGKGTTC